MALLLLLTTLTVRRCILLQTERCNKSLRFVHSAAMDGKRIKTANETDNLSITGSICSRKVTQGIAHILLSAVSKEFQARKMLYTHPSKCQTTITESVRQSVVAVEINFTFELVKIVV